MVTEGSRVVVTVIGQDRVGIIAGVSDVLARYNVNILDISQTIMQELFVMIALVDMSGAGIDLISLQQKLGEKGDELGIKITALHEDVFRYMHRL
ncbi:MAG: ACT domain-containing protein [Firmicutes bacterium]|nr:ACT domain-containing protein [Bacillota bacterium]